MFQTLLLLVTSITLTVAQPTKPELRRIDGSARYTAYNPLRTPILMSIACLGDFEKIDLPLAAGTSLQLEIKQPSGYAASCFMNGYAAQP